MESELLAKGGRLAEIFMVGEWRAARTLNTLERDGQTLQIEPISMDVLVLLAKNAGEVVSIDELIETIWKGRATDGSVYRTINQLRKALDGDNEEPRYIQTIRKRGYRLIAEVTSVNEPINSDASEIPAAITVSPPKTPDRSSIAALPFENLSPEPENAFFADGMHGEVLSQLSKISSLKVISRTSVLEYRAGPKNIRKIARELGVGSILEGTVQRSGGTARINVQLIDAENDEHIWAQIYDRKLTPENVFSIQSEIATAVASALHASLLPHEAARLTEVPTQNTTAYDFYLSGNTHLGTANYISAESWLSAIEAYQCAVEEDPNFAQAWAALSRAHGLLYHIFSDRTASRIAASFDALERAKKLDPDMPEIQLAAGEYYFRSTLDCGRALAEYDLVARKMPGSPELLFARGLVYKRLGRWEQALETFKEASILDPRNTRLMFNQSEVYFAQRKYELADESLQRVLKIDPLHVHAHLWVALIPMMRAGEVTPLMELRGITHDLLQQYRWHAALYQRDYDLACKMLEPIERSEFGWPVGFTNKLLLYGTTYHLWGRESEAEQFLRSGLNQLEETLSKNSDDPRLYVALGEALAGLGKFEEAIDAGRQALAMRPISKDAYLGRHGQQEVAIRVFIRAGAFEEAITQLDDCLGTPGISWTIEGILPDPRLDPIRDDPRFLALVEKHKRK